LPGFVFGELNNVQSFADLVDDGTAAIMVESIQGDGGINPCTPEFLIGLRQLCDQHNLLLMLDEVQCGIGRTGTFYAFENAGIRPDAIAMAKGLGGGFPIGALWTSERAADLFTPGAHGTTFGGTPLACAAGLAVLDVIEREKLLAHVTRVSPAWIAELKAMVAGYPGHVVEVRGRGFHVGIEMRGETAPWITALAGHGLLAAPAGGNVVRFLPPLTATTEELARSVEIFGAVLKAKA
jgi:acetylornithine aminotransferase/acetylornithine/N-succinyldiaminopimelate aminotransferase